MTEEDPREALAKALARLEDLRRKKRRPERRDVRAALIPLGELLLSGDADGRQLAERARPSLVGWAEGKAMADSELALACAEHVHSVDPRYLGLASYDLEYVLDARERLRARMSAAEILGLSVPSALARAVGEADARLEAYLARESGRDPP